MKNFSSLPAAWRRGPGRYLPLLALLAAPLFAQAQTGGVGIGTTAPDASAALDIVSSTKGALLPRVASAAALATPATGLIVFQTGGTAGFYYNAGTPAAPSWQQLATAAGTASTASNGLTKTGNNIALGGPLTAATDVALGSNTLTFSGAGKVGVGTAAPAATLDVNGNFRVATLNTAPGQISQATYYTNPQLTNAGQSFTLPVAATVVSFTFTPGYVFTSSLTLYAGSGNGGTALSAPQAFTVSTSGSPYTITLTTPLALAAGVYTAVLAGNTYVLANPYDPYAGGSLYAGSTIQSGTDMKFAVDYNVYSSTPILSAAAGSVGIGTASPTQALEVAGTVFSNAGGFQFPDNTTQTTAATTTTASNGLTKTGNDIALGGTLTGATTIGQAGNAFSLTQTNVNAATIDQQQPTGGSSTPQVDVWQSFTAGRTGNLTRLDIVMSSTGSTSGGTLSVYAGEGTGGTLLTSQAVVLTNACCGAYQNLTLTAPVAVVAGQQYTYRVQCSPDAFVSFTTANPYAGGRSSTNATTDLVFKTYVSTSTLVPVLTALPTGRVGVGTSAPTVELEVAGNVKFTGTGNALTFPDNTTQTTAAATTTASNGLTRTGNSLGLGGSLGVATTIAQGGNNFSLTGGNVGIGTSSPGQALEVNGTLKFSSTGNGLLFADGSSQTTAAVVATASNGLTKTGNNIALGGSLGAATTIAQGGYAFGLTGGNVGIGTSSPAARLDLLGGADNDGGNDPVALALQWRNGGYRHFLRTRHSNGTTGTAAGGNALDWYLNDGGGAASSTAPGTGNVPALTLANYGGAAQVGIGTTAPAGGLQVLTGNGGVGSGVSGVVLSGAPGAVPNIEIRGSSSSVGTSPYLDFAETNNVDYSTRLISRSGVLTLNGGSTTLLEVAGGVKIDGANTLEFGAGVSGKEANAGKIGYRAFSGDALDIIGAGSSNRLIRFYCENGASFNGQVNAPSFYTSSDQRFKTNVRPLTSALASVLALRGVRYEWNALGVAHGGKAGAPQVGLIAQEVAQLYPELVGTDADGYKAVNYAQLTPVLIEALKEQQQQIEALKAEAAAAKTAAGTATSRAASAEAKAAQATATLETFEARLRRLEAATSGQAHK